MRAVGGSPFDLRVPRRLGDVLDKVPQFECSPAGFDHNFIINQISDDRMNFVARAEYENRYKNYVLKVA